MQPSSRRQAEWHRQGQEQGQRRRRRRRRLQLLALRTLRWCGRVCWTEWAAAWRPPEEGPANDSNDSRRRTSHRKPRRHRHFRPQRRARELAPVRRPSFSTPRSPTAPAPPSAVATIRLGQQRRRRPPRLQFQSLLCPRRHPRPLPLPIATLPVRSTGTAPRSPAIRPQAPTAAAAALQPFAAASSCRVISCPFGLPRTPTATATATVPAPSLPPSLRLPLRKALRLPLLLQWRRSERRRICTRPSSACWTTSDCSASALQL